MFDGNNCYGIFSVIKLEENDISKINKLGLTIGV